MKRFFSMLPVLAALLLFYACNPEPAVLSVSLNKSTLTLEEGQRETLVATVQSTTAKNKSVTWSSDHPAVAYVESMGQVRGISPGVATIKATTVVGGYEASCTVTVKKKPKTVPAGAVDMGLPSGLMWASCNLGASKPEDYGDYYAWGETITYYTDGHSQDMPCSSWRNRSNPSITGYNWSSYKWCGGSNTTIKKYCTKSSYGTVDNITELQHGSASGETMDDVARSKLGGKWQIPSKADFVELVKYTNNSWTTYNGVSGWKFTNKTNSANWIFLPAAGYRSDNFFGSHKYYGFYWSLSLSTDSPDRAYILKFGSSEALASTWTRCHGLSVRPVTE